MSWGRARIGILYPASGLLDSDFHQLAPPGVSVHIQRIGANAEGVVDRIVAFSDPDNLIKYARELAPLHLDCLVYASASGSFLEGRHRSEDQIKALEDKTGIRATSTSQATVRALQRLGVKRVGLATPYVSDFNEPVIAFFRAYGFDVAACENLGLRGDWVIGAQSPETIYRLIRRVAVPHAEAVFVACTGLPSLDLISTLEQDLNRPVLTANQVTMWDALRLCSISTGGLTAFGSLFSTSGR
jgi:maleate isomerase